MQVLLVDDHPLYMEGLKNLMESLDFKIVGTAQTGKEALLKACQLEPEIILMDIQMPGMDGFETTRQIKAKLPDVKIIMLTSIEDDQSLHKAIKAGASGYLLKSLDIDALLRKMQDLLIGDNPFTPGMLDSLLQRFKVLENQEEAKNDLIESPSLNSLSEKQQRIIQLLIKGLTYNEIGKFLFISERTVKYHIKEIKHKLELNSRAEIIAYGIENLD